LLVTQEGSYILTDSRYTEHAAKAVDNFEILEYEGSLPAFFGEVARKLKLARVGFESHDLSVFNLKRLKKFCKSTKLVPVAHLVEGLRAVKDHFEVENIRKAASIADSAFDHILNFARAGTTEAHIAWEMEKFMRESGAEKMAWDPFIVAATPNSSMAHYGAADVRIKKNDMVLVDYGAVYKGYYSDITRVFFVSRPTTEQKKIYDLVYDAQKLGISLVRKGRRGNFIDKKVKDYLKEKLPAAKKEYFYRHGLGHGVGLAVHELPRLSIHSKSKLVAGNVLTVEPGVYIPAWGGIRLEDIVVVKENGCEVLSKAPKEIKEVTII